MTTLLDRVSVAELAEVASHTFVESDLDRRQHRRADLDACGITVNRYDGNGRTGKVFGQIVDLSAGGIRIRTNNKNLRPDAQIRVHMELPDYAGISPFINRDSPTPQPTRQWVGWMAISRVQSISDSETDVAGRLVDMDEMDRGMLSLYLSTQPLAA